jgi:hypothetical protein
MQNVKLAKTILPMDDSSGNMDFEQKRQLIDLLSKHQDQQQKFLDSMEAIRWKFATTFGVGAFLAIVYASSPGDSTGVKIKIGSIILMVVSIASLIAHIRIYGLVYCCWNQIRSLQLREAMITQELYGGGSIDSQSYHFPHSPFSRQSTSHLFTVNFACCIVFSTFLGIGIELHMHGLSGFSRFTFSSVAMALLSLLASWLLSDWYCRRIMKATNATRST